MPAKRSFPGAGTGSFLKICAWLAGHTPSFPCKLSQQQPMTPAKKKILVIDNDPASTRMVRLTLERQPHLRGVRTQRPDQGGVDRA